MGIVLKDQKVLYGDLNLGQIDVDTPVDPVIPTDIPVTSVTVVAHSGQAVLGATAGATLQLDANVQPPNATSPGVTWASSDTSLAVVNANGVVTRVAGPEREGGGSETVTITATAGGKSGSLGVAVLYNPEEETEPVLPDAWIRLEGSDLSNGFITSNLTRTNEGVVEPFTCRSWPMRDGVNHLHMNGVDANGLATDTQVSAYNSSYGLVCPGNGTINGATLNDNIDAYKTFPMEEFTLALRFKYNANVSKVGSRKWGPPGYEDLYVSQWSNHGNDYLFGVYRKDNPYDTPVFRVFIPARTNEAGGGAESGKVNKQITFQWVIAHESSTEVVFQHAFNAVPLATGSNGSFVAQDIFLILTFSLTSNKISAFVNGVSVDNSTGGASVSGYNDGQKGELIGRETPYKHFATVAASSGHELLNDGYPFGGMKADSATACFVGEIAHVSVYPRVLTSEEMEQVIAASNQSMLLRGNSLESYANVRASLIETYSEADVLDADEYLESFLEAEQSVE